MLVILLTISFQLSPNVGKQNRDKNKDESSFSKCQMNACKIVNFLMVDETNFNSEGRGSLFFVFLSKMLNWSWFIGQKAFLYIYLHQRVMLG